MKTPNLRVVGSIPTGPVSSKSFGGHGEPVAGKVPGLLHPLLV